MALTRLGLNQSINLATNTTGTLGVANGGTGLTSGTTDQFLKFTGTTTIASAADNAGKILQIKNATSTSVTNTASSSYVHYSGIDLSITPTSSSSKVILWFTGQADNNANNNRQPSLSCWREIDGANNVLLSTEMQIAAYSPDNRIVGTASWVFVDSPSSTGSVRYRPVIRSTTSQQVSLGNAQTSLVLMEATIA
jgi:hypothetical protein